MGAIGRYIGRVFTTLVYFFVLWLVVEVVLGCIWFALGAVFAYGPYWKSRAWPVHGSVIFISKVTWWINAFMVGLLNNTPLTFLQRWSDDWAELYYGFQSSVRPPNAFEGHTVVFKSVEVPLGWNPHIGGAYFAVLFWFIVALFVIAFGIMCVWLLFGSVRPFSFGRTATVVETETVAPTLVSPRTTTSYTVEGRSAVIHQGLRFGIVAVVVGFLIFAIVYGYHIWSSQTNQNFNRQNAQATAVATQQVQQKIDDITQQDLDNYASMNYLNQSQAYNAANLIAKTPATEKAVIHAKDKLNVACGLFFRAEVNHPSPDGFDPSSPDAPILTQAQADQLVETSNYLKFTVPDLPCSGHPVVLAAPPIQLPAVQVPEVKPKKPHFWNNPVWWEDFGLIAVLCYAMCSLFGYTLLRRSERIPGTLPYTEARNDIFLFSGVITLAVAFLFVAGELLMGSQYIIT